MENRIEKLNVEALISPGRKVHEQTFQLRAATPATPYGRAGVQI